MVDRFMPLEARSQLLVGPVHRHRGRVGSRHQGGGGVAG